jgi:hypothetical protein
MYSPEVGGRGMRVVEEGGPRVAMNRDYIRRFAAPTGQLMTDDLPIPDTRTAWQVIEEQRQRNVAALDLDEFGLVERAERDHEVVGKEWRCVYIVLAKLIHFLNNSCSLALASLWTITCVSGMGHACRDMPPQVLQIHAATLRAILRGHPRPASAPGPGGPAGAPGQPPEHPGVP